MATPKTWVKVHLFLSSYFPLWLIFLITVLIDNYPTMSASYSDFWQFLNANILAIIAIVFLTVITVVPMRTLRKYLEITEKDDAKQITVTSKEDISGEYVLYVVTYIIPFLTDNLLDASRALALIILMVTVGALYIRSNLLYINPVLNIWGYRLYKVQDADNKYIILSLKRSIRKGSTVYASSLSGNIYLEKKTVVAS